MPWIDDVDAILEGYLGGQAGGEAMARLLFGEASPSGKLAETFPLRLEDTPTWRYFPGSAGTVEYREGLYVGYRYYDSAHVRVLFPFGYGLSYTTFEYDNLWLSQEMMGADDTLHLRCSIRNAGRRAGSEVVQLYVHARAGAVYRPDQELKGFEKVRLEPGQSVPVSFSLDRRSLAYFDVGSGDWQVEPGLYDIRIGASSQDIRLVATISVASSFEPIIGDDLRSRLDPYYRAAVAGDATVPASAFEALLGHPVPTSRSSLFDLDTPLGSLRTRMAGRLLVCVLELMLARQAPSSALPMAIREMPLRALVLLGKGRLGFRQARALLDLINGHPVRALARLLR